MNRTVFGKWTTLAFAMSIAGATFAGCSDKGHGSANVAEAGSVGFALSLPSGATVDTVNYTLTGPGGYTKSGSFSVAGPGKTFSYTLPGIPAGMGYEISLMATSSDMRACKGKSMLFNVTAGQSVNVAVVLSCAGKGTSGSIVVNGTLNICPVVDSAIASPASAAVGGSIALNGMGSDEDSGPSALTYAWTATGTAGMLTNASSANAAFTCSAAGSSTITLTVSDSDTQCTGNTLSVDVTCTAGGGAGTGAGTGGAGTGGAPDNGGSGGAGTGAAGTGGAGTGGAGTGGAGTGGAGTGGAGTGGTGGGGTGGGGGGGICDQCEQGQELCAMRRNLCDTATGTVGGVAKSALCQQVLDCIRTTKCVTASGNASDCICGPGADVGVCAGQMLANVTGACKDIIATGAESQSLMEISLRLGDPTYATGLAIGLVQCDQVFCADTCF